jgi:hypothetical protein
MHHRLRLVSHVLEQIVSHFGPQHGQPRTLSLVIARLLWLEDVVMEILGWMLMQELSGQMPPKALAKM